MTTKNTILATIYGGILAILAIFLAGCSLDDKLAVVQVVSATPTARMPEDTPKVPEHTATPSGNPEPVLAVTTYPPHPTPVARGQGARIKTGVPEGAVNLRACASTDCCVLAVLNEGDTVLAIERGDWWFVLHGRRAGYIYGDYLELEQ